MKKFYAIIGNPPYQESRDTTKDMPVYHNFMDESYKVADKVELITPAKYLFNSGATPKQWNEERLNDEHFTVLKYFSDSSNVFPNAAIPGGVAISYRNREKNYGKIEQYSPYAEMNQIRGKITKHASFQGLDTIMFPYSAYTLTDAFWNDFPERKEKAEYIIAHRKELSKEEKKGEFSNLRIITTNVFDIIPEIFFDEMPHDSNEYCCLMGRNNNQRCSKYVKLKYIDVAANYSKYKVLISIADGASGYIGNPIPARMCGEPIVVGPGTGYTQTFQSIGCVDSREEAENIAKYVKTRFARVTLGLLKITQHYPVDKWKLVPLQNFKSDSDIDWTKTVTEIDEQLYRKYNLSDEEILFIETYVKEMT